MFDWQNWVMAASAIVLGFMLAVLLTDGPQAPLWTPVNKASSTSLRS